MCHHFHPRRCLIQLIQSFEGKDLTAVQLLVEKHRVWRSLAATLWMVLVVVHFYFQKSTKIWETPQEYEIIFYIDKELMFFQEIVILKPRHLLTNGPRNVWQWYQRSFNSRVILWLVPVQRCKSLVTLANAIGTQLETFNANSLRWWQILLLDGYLYIYIWFSLLCFVSRYNPLFFSSWFDHLKWFHHGELL